MRQALDNIYHTNGPTRLVDELRIPNPSAIASGKPFQVIGVKGEPTTAVHDLTVPFVAGNVPAFLDVLKMQIERRTGVSDANQGLDPDALSDSTNIIGSMIMTAALQRIKMYARVFAETGFKSLMLHIHELARKYESTDKMFMVNGEFQTINPRSWRERTDMTVKVGIGFSEKRERIANLNQIIANQKEILMAAPENPLVNLKNLYDAFIDMGKESGFADVVKYFTNPETVEQKPKEDPNAGALQVLREQIMAQMQETQAKIDADMAKHAEKLAQDRYEFEQELKLKQEKQDEEYKLKMEDMILKYGEQLKPKEVKDGLQ
jgi:hypothetical protein